MTSGVVSVGKQNPWASSTTTEAQRMANRTGARIVPMPMCKVTSEEIERSNVGTPRRGKRKILARWLKRPTSAESVVARLSVNLVLYGEFLNEP